MSDFNDGIDKAVSFVKNIATEINDFGDELTALLLHEIAEGIEELKDGN
jgi:hypothetical protein